MSNWQELNSEAQIDALKEASFHRPQFIFKHSVRCGISAHLLEQMKASTSSLADMYDLHYLDLIAFRNISNKVADTFGIPHQSPQAILIKDGEAVHHASHFSIETEKILAAA